MSSRDLNVSRTSAVSASSSFCKRRDDLAAQRFERIDRIVARQMHPDDAPPARLERLEIADVLRVVELRETVSYTRYLDRVAMVLRDLEEQAGVGTALVQLPGRMQIARPVAEGRCDTVELDH